MSGIRFIFILAGFVLVTPAVFSQGVGINTTNDSPDPSALLDVKSTSQGILFPRMTTAQRDAIQNPANGLHIFNTESGSLEYYDTVFSSWTRYCNDCSTYSDTITNDITHYTLSAEALSYKKILLVVGTGVNVSGTSNLYSAIDLSQGAAGSSIVIINYGNIRGRGGNGGNGGGFTVSAECSAQANAGGDGGHAILVSSGVKLKIRNYGVIAGGGGGGGGGGAGSDSPNDGGGGGGGAGGYGNTSPGGNHGITLFYAGPLLGCLPTGNALGEDGQPGTPTSGGAGGNGGQSGSPILAGYAGGNGGGPGQPGQAGTDSYYNPGAPGGQPGKAVNGNAGNNTIINMGSGVVYGVVD